MGVDLATYRARIGTFISRRNVSCGDERRSHRTVNTRQFGIEVFKVMHFSLLITREMSSALSQSFDITMRTGYLHPKIQHGPHRKVYLYLVRAARFSLAAAIGVSSLIKQKLLILSGDIEMNPGPRQRTQDPLDCQCSDEDIYKIASLDFNLKAVARRLIGPQLAKDIIDQEELSDQDKRDEVFEMWLKVKGPNATYKELVKLFETLKCTETATAVRMLVASNTQSDEAAATLSLCNDPYSEISLPSLEPKKDPTFTFKNIRHTLRTVVEWKSLSAELEISAAKIKEIEINNRGQVAECKHDIIQFWMESDRSCSWKKLVHALISIDQSVLAEEIRQTYIPVSQGEKASIRDLKGRYHNFRPAQVDFPPVPTFSFTNLALIKDTTETKRSAFFFKTIRGSVDDVIDTKVSKVTITYEELFKSITSENRILLLEGRPGCGKTTLTRKISKDWSEGVILSFVKYLFLIPLRQFYDAPITGLANILEYYALSDLETEIGGSVGQGACFIFDGLDEYSKKYTKAGRSWFERLLRGEVLTSSTIIITSRPNASVELRESAHTRGEVLGFLKEQIDEYIDKSYAENPSKASEVKAYLHNHQNIHHMCYIPLHLVMIMFIYDKSKEDDVPLPKTETDVYKLFTIMSLVRYYAKINKDVVLNDLQSLPSPESALFLSICKLAYNATVASKTSISMKDINNEFSISDIAHLGIIVVDKKEGFSGGEPILSFVHLTNQEFLAAYHLSTLPSNEQLIAIRAHVYHHHMDVVLKFFCGITGLQNIEHWTVLIQDHAWLTMCDVQKVNMRALHYVFESQNGKMCRELFSNIGGRFYVRDDTLTLLDYCIVGYCMESANDTVKSISLVCELTAEGLAIIVQTLTKSMEGVNYLTIQDDLCDKDKLLALKELLHRLPNVESLTLKRCFEKEGWSDWTSLEEFLKETANLQDLYLHENNVGLNGIKALCAASPSLSNLRELHLAKNNLGPNGMNALCAATASLSNLRFLALGYNNLGDDSIESLILVIQQCPLEKLVLKNYNMRFGMMGSYLGVGRKNHFSYQGTHLLQQRAKSIRPGMDLDMDDPPTTATNDDPPTLRTLLLQQRAKSMQPGMDLNMDDPHTTDDDDDDNDDDDDDDDESHTSPTTDDPPTPLITDDPPTPPSTDEFPTPNIADDPPTPPTTDELPTPNTIDPPTLNTAATP